MKKILFWITCPFLGVINITFEIVAGVSEDIVELCHKWEGWCFDYHKKTFMGKPYKYKGAGIWTCGFPGDDK